MLKMLKNILSANRERRYRAISVAIRFLRVIQDIETTELRRYSDKLNELDHVYCDVSKHDYILTEEECSNCENALEFLECAITDLEYAY